MLFTHTSVPVDRGSVGLGLFNGPYPLKNPSLYAPPGWLRPPGGTRLRITRRRG